MNQLSGVLPKAKYTNAMNLVQKPHSSTPPKTTGWYQHKAYTSPMMGIHSVVRLSTWHN